MSCGANFGANEKSSYKKVDENLLVTAWLLMCFHQGMILGPPDYESGALTNWAIEAASFDVGGKNTKIWLWIGL